MPYANPGNYVRVSERVASERGAFWANQFDNTANRDAHAATTGPEILAQTDGKLDAFICAIGSGGTLAGVAQALRHAKPAVKIGMVDPGGSALFGWYSAGELTMEGTSITEGIGQGRITGNFADLKVDYACQVADDEALHILFDLVVDEGLCLGGSAGVNIAGAIRYARKFGPGHTIVTVLCDGGARYATKLYNPEFLREKGLPTPSWM